MAAIFRREGIRLAHLHFAGLDRWGFREFGCRTRIPYVLTFHNFSPAQLSRRRPGFVRRLRPLINGARAITAVSSSCRDAVLEMFPNVEKKTVIVPNGVDSLPENRIFPPTSPEFILSVGDCCWEKGTDVLLFALKDLADTKRPFPKVVLCGRDLTSGGFKGLVRRLSLERRVEFLGPKPHEEVLSLMRRSLFYVCPSRGESFGMAVMEAMACGKAVVAPNAGGISGYMRHGVNGWVFDAGRPESLAGAMNRLFNDSRLRGRLGHAAPAATKLFSWESAARQYEKIYRSVLHAAN